MAKPFNMERRRLYSILSKSLGKLAIGWALVLIGLMVIILSTFVGCREKGRSPSGVRSAAKSPSAATKHALVSPDASGIMFVYGNQPSVTQDGVTVTVCAIGRLHAGSALAKSKRDGDAITGNDELVMALEFRSTSEIIDSAWCTPIDESGNRLDVTRNTNYGIGSQTIFEQWYSMPPKGTKSLKELSFEFTGLPKEKRGPYTVNEIRQP